MHASISSRSIECSGLDLHYLEAGSGDPVLLLHGWPTSSFLWRNVMPAMAQTCRVLALDLPGFGASSKPLDASYSFRYYERVLSDFLGALDIERLGLAVHDLGGPVGLYWATRHAHRIDRLALLNTLVYPEVSWAVVAFVVAVRWPGLRHLITSPWGLRKALEIGVKDPKRLREDAIAGTLAPFQDHDARRALAKAGCNLSPKGFHDLAARLPELTCAIRILYGERDRILPDVAKTMARVKRDLPQAEVSSFADCGHFLQEECPEEIGEILGEFFAAG